MTRYSDRRTPLHVLFTLLAVAVYGVVLWGQAYAPVHLLAHEHSGDASLSTWYEARSRVLAAEHEHHDHGDGSAPNHHDHGVGESEGGKQQHHHDHSGHNPHPATEHRFLVESVVLLECVSPVLEEVRESSFSLPKNEDPLSTPLLSKNTTRGPPFSAA